MYSNSKQKKIKAPLLTLLLDDEPQSLSEKSIAKSIDATTLYEDIRINLQRILNTRFLGVQWPVYLDQLNQSILNYGIDDFTHSYFGNKQSQKNLCVKLSSVIATYESRLSDVMVFALESDMAMERLLKIRIEAQINLVPAPIPAIFESCLDITNQNFSVNE